jgi:hypothetical protein
MNENYVDCFKCKHLSITWDKFKPYGCKAMGFKSTRLPSIDVFINSGHKCLLFEEK